MKYTYSYKVGKLSKEELKHFENAISDKNFAYTGETLEEAYKGYNEDNRQVDGGGTTYAVIKGTWTPYGACRDCGDHFIIARWSRYDSIDKKSMQITKDVEDR